MINMSRLSSSLLDYYATVENIRNPLVFQMAVLRLNELLKQDPTRSHLLNCSFGKRYISGMRYKKGA